MDGKLLALARADLAAVREKNEQETARRRETAFARVPRLRQLEEERRELVSQVIGLALRRGEEPDAALASVERRSLEIEQEQTALLRNAGFPADYLEDRYDCARCRDTGYVEGEPCACLLRAYERQREDSLSRLIRLGDEAFEHFDLSLFSDDEVNPIVHKTPRENMSLILNLCRSYAQGFGENSPNLLFRGGTGLGKTFTSACIARAVPAKGARVVYESVSGALELFEQTRFGRAEPDSEAYEARDRILNCGLLILDDLGTEMQTSFSVSVVYTIVNQRLLSGKKTIISTNLDINALRERYGAQLASRLEGDYVTLLFVGSDIRMLKKNRKNI